MANQNFLSKETGEEALYKSFRDSKPRTLIHNYHDRAKKKKWLTVGYFETAPRDWPSSSKELVECAKFTSEGDAHLYANVLARRPDAREWWAVVVR